MLPEFYDFTAQGPSTEAGIWAKLNWRCVPGICFTGETDNCLTGRMEAPHNVLYDDTGGEFIFRQPRNDDEVKQVIRAGEVDPFQSYGFDGHLRWSVPTIRTWWRERQRVIEWITRTRSRALPADVCILPGTPALLVERRAFA